ncbi:HD-GYP domain-containing protein [Dictyobacter arantiisoli]|uniref:Uncharacterized protein n=1 Tax=Dictyobacter arantiisoli TaxID=2014874 RepID=A0A5A5T8Y2_9CHLR|nr:HD domain-containing phosphohydrolase [Dictyobacter arantiisoli]GCF07636.1 hypothetical protein KDI_12000 [Dictyobacter arantiisoli]
MLINGTATLCCENFLRQELICVFAHYGYSLTENIVDISSRNDVQYRVQALELAIQRTLSVWCDAATCAHARRLVRIAETVGSALHLPQPELILLRLAALLHDIGKVAIPDTILQKRGPLDEDERALVRLHPEIGQKLLQHIGGLFEQIALLVVAHHEAWDGNGYPVGLTGKEIPLLARILAVVDSYDAMVSYRAYGKPLPILHACRELICCAGHQFDPQIVGVFLQVLLNESQMQAYPGVPAKRSPATNEPALADVMSAVLLLQSGVYVRESA